MTLEKMRSYPGSMAIRQKAGSGRGLRQKQETAKPERHSGPKRAPGQNQGKGAIPWQAMDD